MGGVRPQVVVEGDPASDASLGLSPGFPSVQIWARISACIGASALAQAPWQRFGWAKNAKTWHRENFTECDRPVVARDLQLEDALYKVNANAGKFGQGGPLETLAARDLDNATHPYTRGLLEALPSPEHPRGSLAVLKRDPAWAKG